MKKRKTGLWVATVLLAAVIGGCGSEKTADANATETNIADTNAAETTETETQSQVAENFTVTFYDSDGSTVLDTKEVKAGTCVEEFEPEKEGYTFVGWYGTPQMSHSFDFSEAITEDKSVFAGFVSYQEDTRSWAIVGSGSSAAMLESNWGKVISDIHMMQKEEVEGANVYTITLDLMEGDEFQFAIDTAWSDQRGFGYLENIEQDGVEYFANSGSLGDAKVRKSNIKVAVSGNYTFTLTTYPAEDYYDTKDAYYTEAGKENFNYSNYDSIQWVYNGGATSSAAEYQTDYYIKGAVITGWEDVYTDETRFVEADGVYTLTIALTEGDEFLFTTLLTSGDSQSVGNEYVRYTNIAADDSDSLACILEGSSANMMAAKDGTYTFTYNPKTKVLQASCQ